MHGKIYVSDFTVSLTMTLLMLHVSVENVRYCGNIFPVTQGNDAYRYFSPRYISNTQKKLLRTLIRYRGEATRSLTRIILKNKYATINYLVMGLKESILFRIKDYVKNWFEEIQQKRKEEKQAVSYH